MKGSLFLESVVAPATLIPGTLVWSRRNTAAVPSSFLEQYTKMFSRWRVHSYRYRYIPTLSAATAGTLLFASDPDPLASYVAPSSNLPRLSVLEGKQIAQVWEPVSFSLSPSKDFTDLWCLDLNPNLDDGFDRLTSAGSSFMAIVAAGGITPGATIGCIELDYDITFYAPRLGPTSISDQSKFQISWADFATAVGIPATLGGHFNVVDSVFKVVQFLAAKGPALSVWQALGSAVTAYFDWVAWTNATADTPAPLGARPLGAAPTEVAGLTPGTYEVVLEIGAVGTGFVAAPPFLGASIIKSDPSVYVSTIAAHPQNLDVTGGGSAIPSEVLLTSFGNLARINVVAAVYGTRGYGDARVAYDPSAWNGGGATNPIVGISFRRRPAATLVNASTAVAVPITSPAAESKDEDVEPPPAPAYRPPRSRVPGGGLYVCEPDTPVSIARPVPAKR